MSTDPARAWPGVRRCLASAGCAPPPAAATTPTSSGHASGCCSTSGAEPMAGCPTSWTWSRPIRTAAEPPARGPRSGAEPGGTTPEHRGVLVHRPAPRSSSAALRDARCGAPAGARSAPHAGRRRPARSGKARRLVALGGRCRRSRPGGRLDVVATPPGAPGSGRVVVGLGRHAAPDRAAPEPSCGRHDAAEFARAHGGPPRRLRGRAGCATPAWSRCRRGRGWPTPSPPPAA